MKTNRAKQSMTNPIPINVSITIKNEQKIEKQKRKNTVNDFGKCPKRF